MQANFGPRAGKTFCLGRKPFGPCKGSGLQVLGRAVPKPSFLGQADSLVGKVLSCARNDLLTEQIGEIDLESMEPRLQTPDIATYKPAQYQKLMAGAHGESGLDAETERAIASFDQNVLAAALYGGPEILSEAKNAASSGRVEPGILDPKRGIGSEIGHADFVLWKTQGLAAFD